MYALLSHKAVVKVSFDEEHMNESECFFLRLIEKIILDQLELTPHMMGSFLNESKRLIDNKKE